MALGHAVKTPHLLTGSDVPLLRAELYSMFAEIHLVASDYKKYLHQI